MIKNLTERFLTLPRWVLFFLLLMASFNWYDSSDPSSEFVPAVVKLVGYICLFSWIYAVAHRANDHLLRQNIELKFMEYFDYGFILMIVSQLALLIYGDGNKSIDAGFLYLTYPSPIELSLPYLIGFIFVCLTAAKALVSAEKGKEVEFNDYSATFLLFIFYWLGVWWIQARVQKIPHEEMAEQEEKI